MKVAHITPAYHPAWVYGGPPESTYQLTAHLARRGVDIRVLTTDANGLELVLDVDKSRELSFEPGLRVRYCPRRAVHAVAPTLLAHLPAYIAWCDVVHLTAVYNFTTLPTLLLAKTMRKPLVWSLKGALIRWEGATRPFAKDMWEAACRTARPRQMVLHVTSENEAQRSESRMPGIKSVLVPNGVRVPEEARHEASEELRLLFLGRLHPIKGIENLLSACAKLEGELERPWRLIIAGAGEADYEAKLRAQVEELSLGERVRFAGSVGEAEKTKLFETSDLLVAPSYSENFGLAIAEALAHGVPVIAGRGTPWSALESEGAGLWVDNDAKAILRASRMPLLEMGERARRWVSATYGWERMAALMQDVYEGFTSGSRDRSRT